MEKLGYRYTFNDGTHWEPHRDVRAIRSSDAESLADLMYAAYRDTIDYEGETQEQTLEWVRDAFSAAPKSTGEPVLMDCSMAMERDGVLVSACLISMWRGTPLVMTIVTHPEQAGLGAAGWVLRGCLQALKARGHAAALAFITEGNIPSEKLFSRMGFERVRREQIMS